MSLQLYLGTVAIDGAMTSGSHTLTTNVVGAVVGDYCDVLGAGPSGATLVACITAVASGSITLGYAASGNVTDATVVVWKPYQVGRYSLSGEISSLTNQPSISFQADRIKEAVAPVEGQPVLVLDLALVPTKPSANQDGDIFGGSIASVEVTQIAGNANATYACDCVSWASIAARRGTGQPNDISGNPLNGTFSGLAAGGVFQWVANLLVSDISAVSVVTGPTIPTIKFDYTDIASAFDQICEAASDGTTTYIYRFDARRNLFFEIQSTHLAPWNVSNSDAFVGCTYGKTLEKFANSATITPQNSTGDTIDSTLVRTYNNVPSIDARAAIEGGTGYHEIVVASGSANASMDATTLAESIAKTYGEVPTTVQYSTYRGGLRAGHLQTIVISSLGVSGTFLIDSVSLSMASGKPLWQVHAVDGALIGDWRTALADLASGRRFSSVSGGVSNEFYTDAIVANHISPDLANGFNHQVYLISGTSVTVDNLIFTGGSIATGQNFTLRVYQDSVGSRPDPTFGTVYSGTGVATISTTALSLSTYYFRYDGVHFALIGFAPGSGGGSSPAIPPAQPTAVSGAETGSRSLEQPLARTKLTVRVTCTLAAGSTADRARVWLSQDGGALYVDQGEFHFNPSVPTIDFPAYAPPSAGTWRVKVTLGNVGAYNAPASATVSANFTIAAIAPPGTSLGSSTVTVTSGAGGSWPYNVTRPNGTNFWSIPSITFDDTPALADPSAFFLRWTSEDYDASSVSVRGEEACGGEQISVAGAVKILGPIMGEYGTAPNRTGNICFVRFRLYICSRVQQTGAAWLNSAAATLQKTVDVTVAAGGAIPDDSIPTQFLDPDTIGTQLTFRNGKLDGLSPFLADGIINGNFEDWDSGVDPGGWVTAGSVVRDPTPFGVSAPSGQYSCTFFPHATLYPSVSTIDAYQCKPAEKYVLKATIRSGGSANADLYIFTAWADATGSISYLVAPFTAAAYNGAFTDVVASLTVPAGKCYCQVIVNTSALLTVGYWSIDNIRVEKQVSTGDGLQEDGFGGVKAWLGDGVEIAAGKIQAALDDGLHIVSGKVAPNLGGGLHVNPSTHLLEPDNLAIGHFGSSIRPVALFSSDPSLPDANYPVGTYGFNVTTKIFKRVNNAGNAWVLAVDGGKDIQAGTVTANEIDATSLNAAIASFGYVATSYLTANYITAGAIAAAYATITNVAATYATITNVAATYATITNLNSTNATLATVVANYISATTVAATYATISALNAKTIAAGNITTGTCSASVSFTAPTITVSGSGWTINLDTTNGFKVTNTSNSDHLQLVSGALLLEDSATTSGCQLNLRHPGGGQIYGEVEIYGAGTQSNDLRLRPLTSTTVGAAGGASALPATPLGYFQWNLNGSTVRVPYYN
jgi:hypothetical protein